MDLLKPNTPHRRLHTECFSKAEQHLTEAIAEMQKLGVSPAYVSKTIFIRTVVADLVDEKGEYGHFWQFDAERGGVHCSRCKRRKDSASQDGSPCTGDPAEIAVS